MKCGERERSRRGKRFEGKRNKERCMRLGGACSGCSGCVQLYSHIVIENRDT